MELIAQASSGPAGAAEPADVLVTAGAAQALFIIATTLLEKGDHLVVVRPNYATNIFTPRAIEADISYLELTFEDGWQIDVDKLMALTTPATKYVSITVPHNPTGQMMDEAELRRLIEIVEMRGCRLLVDETYREMTFGEPLPCAATLSDRAISVSSLSKTYGIPGIRTGWLDLPRPRAHADLPRRQGADRHLRQRRGRGDRLPGAGAARRLAARDPRPHPRRRWRSRATGWPARSSWSGSSPRAAS